MIVNDEVIARVTVISKDLYVANIQKVRPSSNEYKITLSESKNDAVFLDEEEDIKAVDKLFSVNASYIRLNTTENDISNLIWRN